MAEYIDRETLLDNINWHMDKFPECAECLEIALKGMVREIHAADVVSAAAYKQATWERDTALGQLKEIGKGLGEKMDDVVPVVRCKDCERSYIAENRVPEERTRACWLHGINVKDDFFCSAGLSFEDEA